MKYKIVKSSDELYHYGVLGMKWGVRKSGYSSGNNQRKNAKKIKKANKSNNVEVIKKINSKAISEEDLEKYKNNKKNISAWAKKYKDIKYDIYDDWNSKESKQMYKEAKNEVLKNPNKYISLEDQESAKKYAKEKGLNIFDTKPYDRALSYLIYDGNIGDKYNKLWKENHIEEYEKAKKSDEEWNKLDKKRQELYKKVSNDVLGKYGSRYISNYPWGDKYEDIALRYMSEAFEEKIKGG